MKFMSYSIDEFNEESLKLTRAINSLLERLVREKQDPNEKITARTLASMAATLERTQRIGRLALKPDINDLVQTELDLTEEAGKRGVSDHGIQAIREAIFGNIVG